MRRDKVDIRKGTEERHVSINRGGLEIQRLGKPVGDQVGEGGLVYLAIDCSASMAGAKLEQAKAGAIGFFNEARLKGYAVGLIRFETSATHICEPQKDLSGLRRFVEKLRLGGSTDMAGGIQLAVERLRQRTGVRAIVVVTDGLPNNRKKANAAAQEAKDREIDIITIGTEDADRIFLKELASRSDLSVMVSSDDLGSGIASTAKMLPGTDSNRRLSGC